MSVKKNIITRQLDRYYKWRGLSGQLQKKVSDSWTDIENETWDLDISLEDRHDIIRLDVSDRWTDVIQRDISDLYFSEEDHQDNVRSEVSESWTDILQWDKIFRRY